MTDKATKRHLVTSALPYINGVKHLGNLVGSLLPADVYSRYLRQAGCEVLFVCATDEHGTPAEIAAQSANQEVAAFCTEQFEVQRKLYARFGLSFDHFGRSSGAANHELTKEIFLDLHANGFIDERTEQQLFSVGDNRYLPDRFVTGTCPVCNFEQARGDQCENCTSLLDSVDLINPRSTISGDTNIEVRSTRHLYLRLSALEPEIREWVESQTSWPKVTSGIASKWLSEGLHDRCITRDLEWGVPVPLEGYSGKVFYVWFDAPIAYVAMTKEWAETGSGQDWKSWWTSDNVEYTQFMAKDNVPFHTIFWPGALIGTRKPWHLVDHVKGFSWLNYYGGKFSTSQKRGVFMDRALEVADADVWRWVLLAMAPESSDTAFTWETFQTRVNSELAGKFGNFVNRSLTLSKRNFGDVVPLGGQLGPKELELERRCQQVVEDVSDYYAANEFRKTCAAIRDLWDLGNSYINDCEPWKIVATDRERAATVLRTCLNLVRVFATVQYPIMPTISQRVLDMLGVEAPGPFAENCNLTMMCGGEPLGDLEPLVRRVQGEDVERLKDEFGQSNE